MSDERQCAVKSKTDHAGSGASVLWQAGESRRVTEPRAIADEDASS